jgi:tetratricopeptide (TPR) repeat protein
MLLAASLALARPAAAQTAVLADSAWRGGDVAQAERLYLTQLSTNPNDEVALHRLALIRAWANRLDESLTLFDQLLDLSPSNVEAAADRAKVLAWGNDYESSIRAYEELLEDHPGSPEAIRGLAKTLAWDGRLDESLSLLDELLTRSPGDLVAALDRATVLSWMDNLDGAIKAYEAILAERPDHAEALLGLARVRSWADELDSAEAIYADVLAGNESSVQAAAGFARMAAWGGDLLEAERRWREAFELNPQGAELILGLGETLRWQGRNAAALDAFEEVQRLSPGHPRLAGQLDMTRAVLAPRGAPALLYETDSDGNRIATVRYDQTVWPARRLALRLGGYGRTADQDNLGLSARSYGGHAELEAFIEPGWKLTVGGGASRTDLDSARTVGSYLVGLSTPGRESVGLSGRFERRALDETAQLMWNGVVMDEWQVGARFGLFGRWRLDASFASATYDGTEENDRLGGLGALTWRPASRLWVTGSYRAFGFDLDLEDGYFDPEYYGIAELGFVWEPKLGSWRLGFEVVPGVQEVRRGDSRVGATGRAASWVTLETGPASFLRLRATYSTTGLNSFATGDAEYRYFALSLGGSLAF